MEEERRSPIFIIMFALLVLGIGVAALGIRYKAVALEDRILMVERWTGRAVFIYGDGSSKMVERHRSVKGPSLMPRTSPSHAGVQLRIKLQWRSARAHYIITAQPYTEELKKSKKNSKAYFVIDILDRDGFIVHTLWVPISKMKSLKNGDDEITSLEYRMNVETYLQDFKDIKNWQIR